ncbi:MAG: UvrABC system protein C [bacterium]|nr:excinuclease ABC subunit UvrC [bacterium]MBV6482581.1 UvrABC system protein C [bacterium]
MLSSIDLGKFPTNPGVYLMKNADEEILYIGKAVNIQSRLRSHAANGHVSQSLYRQVESVDFIMTENELEALILELLLIKEHLPRYNVQLKDDKRYPFLKLTLDEKFPRLYLTRTLPGKGEGRATRSARSARYFGPFPHVYEARTLLRTLQEVLPLRTCKIPSGELVLERPCLEFEMHRCLAPCVSDICNEEEYRDVALKVLKFLSGDHKSVGQVLEKWMQEAAENLSFEKAAIYRDALKALETFRQRQSISMLEEDSEDYLAGVRLGDITCVVILRRRSGSLRGSEHYFLEDEAGTEMSEVLSAFITQHYESCPEIPRRLLCSVLPSSVETLEMWLTSLIAKKVEVRKPHRGPRLKLIDLAVKNAEFHAAERYRKGHGTKRRLSEGVLRLGADLGLSPLPVRIEGFDISHHRGEEAVASMVVFENGVPKKSDYRKFKIKTATGGDDFRSMHEVISRRFRHQDETFGPLPDLVLIDGGPVQISFAHQAMLAVAEDLEEPLHSRMTRQQMISLAKREEEIFLAGTSDPIVLDLRHPGLQLLMQVRDESHRFAIGFHRQRKSADRKTSALAQVKGVGPARLEKLLIHFGSIEKISQATIEELCQLAGVTPSLAERILAACQTFDRPPPVEEKASPQLPAEPSPPDPGSR